MSSFSTHLTRAALVVALALPLGSTARAQTRAAPADAATDGGALPGHVGAGFYGLRTFQFGRNTSYQADVATVGARYWLPGGLGGHAAGVDVGVGLGFRGGDRPSASGFGLHAGLPIVLAQARHVNFEIVPQLDFAYIGSTEHVAGQPDISWSGTAFGFGATAGFEVFFGFIGIPQLSLEAGVGLAYTYDRVSSSQPVAGGTFETRQSEWSFGTYRGNEPWDIFRGSVAARYYF